MTLVEVRDEHGTLWGTFPRPPRAYRRGDRDGPKGNRRNYTEASCAVLYAIELGLMTGTEGVRLMSLWRQQ